MSPEQFARVKPCPFDGTHNIEEIALIQGLTFKDDDLWQVICSNGCRGPFGSTQDEAIEKWNRGS